MNTKTLNLSEENLTHWQKNTSFKKSFKKEMALKLHQVKLRFSMLSWSLYTALYVLLLWHMSSVVITLVSLVISPHLSLLCPGLLCPLHKPPERQIVVGICAMMKKSKSKPMTQILERLCKFDYINVVIFPEEVILEEPVEKWPLCDCLISFHSKGTKPCKQVKNILLHEEKRWQGGRGEVRSDF